MTNPVFGPAPWPDPFQPLDLAQQQRFIEIMVSPGLLIDGRPLERAYIADESPQPVTDDRTRGLYGKYCVSRADGQDAPGAEYFVLRLDKGLAPELAAMRAYVAACEAEYPQLAADLRARYLAADKPAQDLPTIDIPAERLVEKYDRLWIRYSDGDPDGFFETVEDSLEVGEEATKHDMHRTTYVLLHKGRYYRFSAEYSYNNGYRGYGDVELTEVRPVPKTTTKWKAVK